MVEPRAGTATIGVASGAILLALGWQAWHMPTHTQRGFRELASLLGTVAPDQAVLYDGYFHGALIFYVRANDAAMRRMVVRGDKLLYVIPLGGSLQPRDFVNSPNEVVEILRTRSGCRWLAIEHWLEYPSNPAYQYLRDAVQGPLFRHVASVPIIGARSTNRVDLYKFQIPIEQPDQIEFPVPLWGERAQIKVRPVSLRSRQDRLPQKPRGSNHREIGHHESASTVYLDRDPDAWPPAVTVGMPRGPGQP